MKTNIGIPDEESAKIAEILNKTLSNEELLYIKTKNYHWNLVSPNFHSLHLFFDELAAETLKVIDEVAERVRTIGHFAVGTLNEFLELTDLLESKESLSDESMIKNLLADNETIIKKLRNEISFVQEKSDDFGTADFLTGILEKHEAQAWMLRSYFK